MMKNLCFKWLLPAALLGIAYKKRYRILNFLLGNEWLRKMSVNTAMNIPGVRERLISSTFRK